MNTRKGCFFLQLGWERKGYFYSFNFFNGRILPSLINFRDYFFRLRADFLVLMLRYDTALPSCSERFLFVCKYALMSLTSAILHSGNLLLNILLFRLSPLSYTQITFVHLQNFSQSLVSHYDGNSGKLLSQPTDFQIWHWCYCLLVHTLTLLCSVPSRLAQLQQIIFPTRITPKPIKQVHHHYIIIMVLFGSKSAVKVCVWVVNLAKMDLNTTKQIVQEL